MKTFTLLDKETNNYRFGTFEERNDLELFRQVAEFVREDISEEETITDILDKYEVIDDEGNRYSFNYDYELERIELMDENDDCFEYYFFDKEGNEL